MPLYEYECESCGNRFEVIQRVNDSPLLACIRCEGSVERLLSSPAIQFKGSGWYVTDYARKSSSSGEEKPKTATSGDGAAKTAESAPATKTD
jgi:putative FmdB family regulatory protein